MTIDMTHYWASVISRFNSLTFFMISITILSLLIALILASPTDVGLPTVAQRQRALTIAKLSAVGLLTIIALWLFLPPVTTS